MWVLGVLGYVIGAVVVTMIYRWLNVVITGLLLSPTLAAQALTANKPKVSGAFAIFNVAAVGVASIVWWFVNAFVIIGYTVGWVYLMPDYTTMFMVLGGIWWFST